MTLYLNTVYKYVAITQRSLALFIFLRGFKQHVLLVDFQKYIWLFSFNLNHPDSQKQWHRKRQRHILGNLAHVISACVHSGCEVTWGVTTVPTYTLGRLCSWSQDFQSSCWDDLQALHSILAKLTMPCLDSGYQTLYCGVIHNISARAVGKKVKAQYIEGAHIL